MHVTLGFLRRKEVHSPPRFFFPPNELVEELMDIL